MPPHLLRADSPLRRPVVWAELFAFSNLAFLAVDTYLAHAVNNFKQWTQWTPVVFSLLSPLLLIVAWFIAGLTPPLPGARGRLRAGRMLGLAVGWGSIAVGVAGMIFHLDAHFFRALTLHNLVYTAPFVAPLAYAGLGLLLILNRTSDATSEEWAQWVIVLAIGGFFGNFVLGLCDHAQNGFFRPPEWIPVFAAAIAVGFLAAALLADGGSLYRGLCLSVMALEILVGVLGFYYHVMANLHGPMKTFWENFIYGAPSFAPLLFPNLAMLGAIGLFAQGRTAGFEASVAAGRRTLA